MNERARRVGANEALFRTVNEEVRGLSKRFAVVEDPLSVVCECGLADCSEHVAVPAEDYERVRAEPTYFIILPGHELPDVESVVERHEQYFVVRKHEGLPAELAREADRKT
jgi:hypothetical protein